MRELTHYVRSVWVMRELTHYVRSVGDEGAHTLC